MCWKAIWKKNGKAVKGLSEGTFWKFLHTTESCQNSCYLSEGTFWKFLHTTGSCQNSCYLTPWLLYAYIYAQSEKAFNSQCKHSIVLRHVFFKKWTITPLKKSSSANFDGVPLCIRVSDPLAVNSLSKGDTSPTKRSLPRANRTGGCCRGLCWIQAPPCQNCMKKSPLADFDRVPLCIRVSNPLMVNSLSKGDISPTRRSLPRANCTGGCCRGLCRSWTPPCQNCMKKIALGWLWRSPALHPSERSSRSKLTIEGGHLSYQTQFTASKSDWWMLQGTLPKLGTPLPKLHV